MRTIERDVLCAHCGAVIDHEARNAAEHEFAERHSGMLESMLFGDSSREHRRETGCTGSGAWKFGPWSEHGTELGGSES